MSANTITNAPASTTSIHAEQSGDETLLRLLFAEARTPELAALPNDDVRALFLDQQFSFWERHLANDFPSAERLVLKDAAGMAIGRLVLLVTAESIHVVDIAIVAAAQRRGHGSAVMLALLERAGASGLPITLNVAYGNEAAHSFYARFGLVDVTPPEELAGTHRALRSAALAARAGQAAPELPRHADFLRLVGSAFAAVDERGHRSSLTLTACTELRRLAAGTASYSLTFHGAGTSSAQGTFTLARRELGDTTLFLVPTGRDERGTEYTATINTLET